MKFFKISRSKIDLFLRCPRCFYLDRKLGISQPSGAPFTLNNLVDALLKKSFDEFRQKKSSHPFQVENDINAINNRILINLNPFDKFRRTACIN